MTAWSSKTIPGNNARLRNSPRPFSKGRGSPRPLGVVLRAVCFLGSLLIVELATAPRSRSVLHAEEEARESAEQPIVIAPPRSGVRVGERLSFHGRWFGIPVGHGWIEVKEVVSLNGRQAYAIEAQGHSNEFLSKFYPVHDVIRSYLDVETLQPLRFEKNQREGHYRAEEVVTFDYDRMLATYHSLLNQSTKEIPISASVQDIISAFYWLRTHPLESPASVLLDVYSDEKIYQTQIKLLKTLMLELLWRGTFPCLMVEPVASFKGILVRRGRVWFYVSVDPLRIPLFVKISTPWGPITGVIDAESLKALQEDVPDATRHPTGS